MKKRIFAVIIASILLATLCCACKKTHTVPASARSYTVTFITSSAQNITQSFPSQKVKRGGVAAEPQINATPQTGYRFIWTLSPSAVAEYDFGTQVLQDITLYAVEVPRVFCITYLTGDGQKGANPDTYTVLDTVLFASAVTPFGYSFEKWCYFDDENSEVTELAAGTVGDKVLRAVYNARTFEVYYRVDGGTNNPQNASQYLYGTDFTLSAPTKKGYIFEGWYAYSETLGEGGGVLKVEALTAEFVKNNSRSLIRGGVIVLEAHWRKA